MDTSMLITDYRLGAGLLFAPSVLFSLYGYTINMKIWRELDIVIFKLNANFHLDWTCSFEINSKTKFRRARLREFLVRLCPFRILGVRDSILSWIFQAFRSLHFCRDGRAESNLRKYWSPVSPTSIHCSKFENYWHCDDMTERFVKRTRAL